MWVHDGAWRLFALASPDILRVSRLATRFADVVCNSQMNRKPTNLDYFDFSSPDTNIDYFEFLDLDVDKQSAPSLLQKQSMPDSVSIECTTS